MRFPIVLSLLVSTAAGQASFESAFPEDVDRGWIGPEWFANRLQDWRLDGGRVECVTTARNMPVRTLQLLTHTLGEAEADISISVETGTLGSGTRAPESLRGLLLGGGGTNVDYRLSAMIHSKPGPDGGLLAVIDEAGRVALRDFSSRWGGGGWSVDGPLALDAIPELDAAARAGEGWPAGIPAPVRLEVEGEPVGDGYRVRLAARLVEGGALVSEAVYEEVPSDRLDGCVALVSHLGANGGGGAWFRGLSLERAKVEAHPERALGPVLAIQYTLSRGTLALTAQSVPLGAEDPRTAALEVRGEGGEWVSVAEAELTPLSCTFPFRVEGWDATRDRPVRVVAGYRAAAGVVEAAYEGLIRSEPDPAGELVLAAFTGHKCYTGSPLSWNSDAIWFPHSELVAAVRWHDPDVLFFSGDQIYEGDLVGSHLPRDGDSIEDYLYKWYRWCWVFGDLTRERPAITIPDDHDVYHGNIWGAGGVRAVARDGMTVQDAGGYKLAGHLVNAIHRTQVSHLPAPADPEPIGQGVSVYHTSVDYGGVSFAVIADRMWKDSPTVKVPDGECVNGFFRAEEFDARTGADVDAVLLGDRQLAFLEDWAADWSAGARHKVVLSQTIFANVATLPTSSRSDAVTPGLPIVPPGGYPPDDEPVSDGDSNGWPRGGRDRALRAIRRGFALHVAGDQHLGSTVEYGIDAWGDAGFALCVPSVANTWPRRWYPREPGANAPAGAPRYAGDFLDGFGNRMTVRAVSNPVDAEREPAALYDRAPGYGIARLDGTSREIELEVWPRWVDPSVDGAKQFAGWPIVVRQDDGHGRPVGHLPPIRALGVDLPVVQLVDEDTGEIVYTVRARSSEHRAAVFNPGTYTLRVGDPDRGIWRELESLAPVSAKPAPPIEVDLR